MKKLMALMVALVLCLSLCACGKSAAVKETEAAIDEIGEVTLESKSAIEIAERKFDSLTDKEKEKVENRLILSEAEAEYERLIKEAAEAEIANLKNALATAEDKMSFVQKYAGNVNNQGKRKFADSFISELQTCFDGVNMETLETAFPEIAEKAAEIKANCEVVCDLLVDMGKTNLATNVDRIKNIASETVTKIGTLRDSALSQYQ